jgi:hypothetical protein
MLSNRDMDNLDNSMTLILTDDRRSINRNDSVLYEKLNLPDEKEKNPFTSEMDFFLKNNGFNNIKI